MKKEMSFWARNPGEQFWVTEIAKMHQKTLEIQNKPEDISVEIRRNVKRKLVDFFKASFVATNLLCVQKKIPTPINHLSSGVNPLCPPCGRHVLSTEFFPPTTGPVMVCLETVVGDYSSSDKEERSPFSALHQMCPVMARVLKQNWAFAVGGCFFWQSYCFPPGKKPDFFRPRQIGIF